jgi:hypothetical protein
MNIHGVTKLGVAIQAVYCIISALLVFDYNLGFGEVLSARQSPGSHGVTVLTICTHGALMCIMVFIHINPNTMSQYITVARSLVFMLLSILWSYMVGVHNTVQALHLREDCKQEERFSNGGIRAFVQPIIHCHLRFGAALVVDPSYLIVWAPTMLVCVVMRSYRSRLSIDHTHPDYCMHTETTKDPFSTMLYVVNAATNSTKQKSSSPSLPTVFDSSSETNQFEDSRSEFQKALAAAQL